jgi:uncharacterized cupredoxin-like copper-binding protein
MKLTRPSTLAAALVVALLGAAAAGVVAHAGASTKTITVTEKEFRIVLSAKTASAGSVRFVVKNTGKISHALELSGPGLAKKKTALIKPGGSSVLTATVKAGSYSLWCPVPGHAAQGMKAKLTVTGASSLGGTGTGGGPTTPDGMTTDGGTAWG